ncbi:MAG TPA: hypothetical protein VNT01_02580 [Symbiobacteriaceae bacterium]|nr:hypothetical protein [Symbiobacteriaceae bacterium]
MDGILSGYTVMQQAEWDGRRFFSAHDRRTGQVVHLIAGPVTDPLEPYRHPSLPHVQPLAVETDTRWLVGSVTEGDTFEDLRNGSHLSESDIVSALLSVLDAIGSLALLPQPPVPAYLDPACIKRDRLGRWTLDYLALAHAPEARMAATHPHGVYAFGVLLYWLITGQTVRRSRVQIQRIAGVSSALQFVLIRCLSRSYPSLAELRADIERAGQEHEFRQVLQKSPARPPQPALPSQPAHREDLLTHLPVIPVSQEPTSRRLTELEHHRVKLGGPQIPMDDRPWALPPRPAEGYRKYVVPPPPNPRVVKAIRWGSLGLVSLATFFLASAVAVKAGFIPQELLPVALRSGKPVAQMPEHVAPSPPPEPAGPIAGPPVPLPAPEEPPTTPPPNPAPPPPKSPPPPIKLPTTPVQPPPTTPVPVPPPKQPAPPPPQTPPPAEPSKPPKPELGTADSFDASQGGLPVFIHVNNAKIGWAYIFPHPANPYISINTFNRLFGRNLYWLPQDGGSIRLFNGNQNVITADYDLVGDRLWLKLTPFLQQALGVQVKAYNESGMYFSNMP